MPRVMESSVPLSNWFTALVAACWAIFSTDFVFLPLIALTRLEETERVMEEVAEETTQNEE